MPESAAPNVTPFDPSVASGPPLQKGPQGKKAPPDPLQDVNRSMPFSDDSEKGVLSCLLQNPANLLNEAQVNLPPEAFYHPANRLLYDVLLDFNQTNRPVDIVVLAQHLLDKGLMDKIGGAAVLAELYDFVPTPAHWPYYRGILHDKLILRRIINACTENIQHAYGYNEDVPALLDKVEQRVLSVREDSLPKKETLNFKQIVG